MNKSTEAVPDRYHDDVVSSRNDHSGNSDNGWSKTITYVDPNPMTLEVLSRPVQPPYGIMLHTIYQCRLPIFHVLCRPILLPLRLEVIFLSPIVELRLTSSQLAKIHLESSTELHFMWLIIMYLWCIWLYCRYTPQQHLSTLLTICLNKTYHPVNRDLDYSQYFRYISRYDMTYFDFRQVWNQHSGFLDNFLSEQTPK